MTKKNMANAAKFVLKNPLDPRFKIRWMDQFTTEYLQEFVHVCRDRLLEANDEWLRLSATPRVKKADVERALKHKRMICGRLTAVVHELNGRGYRVPRQRKTKG